MEFDRELKKYINQIAPSLQFLQDGAPLLVAADQIVLVGRLGRCLVPLPAGRETLLHQLLPGVPQVLLGEFAAVDVPGPALLGQFVGVCESEAVAGGAVGLHLLVAVKVAVVVEGFLESGILEEVVGGDVADVADFVVDDSVVAVLEGALGGVLAERVLVLELDVLLQLRLQLRVGPPQEVVLQLQLSALLLRLLHLLPQLLHFDDQLLQFLVVELVELVHLQLNDFPPQLRVLTLQLLHPLPAFLPLRHLLPHRLLNSAVFGAGRVQPVAGLGVAGVGGGAEGRGGGVFRLFQRPALAAAHGD